MKKIKFIIEVKLNYRNIKDIFGRKYDEDRITRWKKYDEYSDIEEAISEIEKIKLKFKKRLYAYRIIKNTIIEHNRIILEI